MKIFVSYLLTMAVFFIIDLIWLGLIAKGIYSRSLDTLLAEQVNWAAAIIFYLLYIAGIMVFAVFPAVNNDSVYYAVFYGAFFGLVAYATYDLTNYATLKGWPLKIVVIDLVWGTVLTLTVAVAGFFITRYVKAF